MMIGFRIDFEYYPMAMSVPKCIHLFLYNCDDVNRMLTAHGHRHKNMNGKKAAAGLWCERGMRCDAILVCHSFTYIQWIIRSLMRCRFTAFTLHVTQCGVCISKCKNLFCLHISSKVTAWAEWEKTTTHKHTLFNRTDPSNLTLLLHSKLYIPCTTIRQNCFNIGIASMRNSMGDRCPYVCVCVLHYQNQFRRDFFFRRWHNSHRADLIPCVRFYVSKIDCKCILLSACDGITIYWTK